MTASPETVPDRTIPAATPTVTRRTPLPEIEPEPSGALDRFLVALFVAVGASYGGTMVFDYGFNVETAGDSPVWHKSETDVFPGDHD